MTDSVGSSFTEFNESGRINESLHSLLEQLLLSEEFGEDEFVDCNSRPVSEMESSHAEVSRIQPKENILNYTFSNTQDNLFEVEEDHHALPIHLKMMQQLGERRRSRTEPKPISQRKIFDKFDVNQNENIKKLRSDFAKKNDQNISNLESVQKDAILVTKYSQISNEISDFMDILKNLKDVVSNCPEKLRNTQLFKYASDFIGKIEKQLLPFENRNYNHLSDLDNAFAILHSDMEMMRAALKQLQDNIFRYQADIDTQRQQSLLQQQQRQQLLLQQQQQLQLQQQLIHTSTPIHPPKSSENFPDNFFKLSTLKVPTRTDPKDLIKQLVELETKCTIWEKQWQKDKINHFKRVANTTINAISSHDVDSLLVKINTLHKLLSGQTIDVLNLNFRAESKDEIDYFSNLITAKLIKKGEQEVSSNPKSAHPIACVAVCLCSNHPSLSKLLLAALYRACPLIAPIFPAQTTQLDSKEYLLSIGYKVKEDKLEELGQFSSRIKGILRLFTCIMQFPIEDVNTVFPIQTHFYGVDKAWAWIVQLLQGPLVPGVSDVALHEAFELMGNRMVKIYGSQFLKLMGAARGDFLSRLSAASPPEHNPSLARLKKFLDDHKSEISETDGAFSAGFWKKNVFK